MGLLEVDFKYPEDLVGTYGAKAGLLMYVGQHLPEISQMPMVVSRIGEPPGDFLDRVDQATIGWPRLFRSSAIAELVGHEGEFPTYAVDTFKGEDGVSRYLVKDGEYTLLGGDEEFRKQLEDLVRKIATSSQRINMGYQLPPEINVIAAEYAPCRYTGALIKHPNRPDFYLTTFTKRNDPIMKLTLTYGPESRFYKFGQDYRNLISLTQGLEEELEEVIKWHDAIAALPEMDQNWVYLLEYGLMPARLFQVHFFKRVQKAGFTLDHYRGGPYQPIVMGVTAETGDDFELVFSSLNRAPKTNLPPLFYANIHQQRPETGIPGVMLTDCAGILGHQDARILRESGLALIYPIGPPNELQDGMVINVVSDGIASRLTNKLTGEEIY